MIDMRKNLDNQKLVIYEFRITNKDKTAYAHSFIDKETNTETALRSYFGMLNAQAKKENIDEILEYVRITGEYDLIDRNATKAKEEGKE